MKYELQCNSNTLTVKKKSKKKKIMNVINK